MCISLKVLIDVLEKQCVYCEIGTALLRKIQMDFRLYMWQITNTDHKSREGNSSNSLKTFTVHH
jgi:hypothetical protein